MDNNQASLALRHLNGQDTLKQILDIVIADENIEALERLLALHKDGHDLALTIAIQQEKFKIVSELMKQTHTTREHIYNAVRTGNVELIKLFLTDEFLQTRTLPLPFVFEIAILTAETNQRQDIVDLITNRVNEFLYKNLT